MTTIATPVRGESQISWMCLKLCVSCCGLVTNARLFERRPSSRVVLSMISSSSRLASQRSSRMRRALDLGQLFGLHELIDVGAIAGVGGNAAGRGVRLHQVAARLQFGHLVANRRRAHAQIVLLGERVRTDRLGGRDVLVDDRRQDVGLALVQPACSSITALLSTPGAGVLAGAGPSARSIASGARPSSGRRPRRS